MQIRTFTKENAALLYLSAYIEVSRRHGRVSLRNSMFDEPMTLRVEDEKQTFLLRKLDEGVSMEQAVSLMAECLKEDPETALRIVKQMMVRGILE